MSTNLAQRFEYNSEKNAFKVFQKFENARLPASGGVWAFYSCYMFATYTCMLAKFRQSRPMANNGRK